MGTRTFIRQDVQVRKSESYSDSTAPSETNFQTNATDLQYDLNCIRSMLHELRDTQDSHWYTALAAPSAYPGEGALARGVQDVNEDLYDIERKRLLRRRAVVGAGIGPIATNAQHVVLDAAGELPGNTTAAVGAVSTRGTVVAYEASFNTATLTEVAGSSAIQPKNLVIIVDTATGDVIVDGSGREVFGLLQSEIATDGHTINLVDQRVQISFVVRNATFDDLQLAAAGVMDAKTIDYSPVERYAFEDLPEQAWLGEDFVDVGAASTTRQGVYDNQGTTPVDLTTNATLDIESAGKYWEIRDDAEATLFRITEGSAGGTTEVLIDGDVDSFNVDAAAVDFAEGIVVDSDGTDIDIGVTTPGAIQTTGSDDFTLKGAGELYFDDGNRAASDFSVALKLTETDTEWDELETAFGEVSLASMLLQAYEANNRAKGIANVITGDINANTNITGAGGSPNISAQMPSYKGLTFVDDVEIYINGVLQRPGADASANNDVYPHATPANQATGDFYCEYDLKYRGGTNPDVIQMLVWGEPTP